MLTLSKRNGRIAGSHAGILGKKRTAGKTEIRIAGKERRTNKGRIAGKNEKQTCSASGSRQGRRIEGRKRNAGKDNEQKRQKEKAGNFPGLEGSIHIESAITYS